MLREAGIGVALVVLVIFFSVFAPRFASPANFANIFTQISINTVIAVGMTFVILLGGIDLSVGSVLARHRRGRHRHHQPGIPRARGHLAGDPRQPAVGGGFGLFNGYICEHWKIHSFIVTLGTLNIARGAALQISGSRTIFSFPRRSTKSAPRPSSGSPSSSSSP